MARLRSPWGASEIDVIQARADAAKHGRPDRWFLPVLGATESNPDMHLIWQHCMRSQILPSAIRQLGRDELEYLAAHSGEAFFVNQEGALLRGQIEKLRANADRARYELERRDRIKASSLVTFIAAAIGGGAGGLVVWLLS
jgi:hypothetical protein